MACELSLTGSLVVGGDGCGCGGASGGGATKVQQLGLACPGSSFGAIGSTDCPVTINSPSEFIPLPGGAPSSIELLYVNTSAAMTLRWGGTIGSIAGTTVVGGITFVGGEAFDFSVTKNGFATPYAFNASAGTYTLDEIKNQLNAELVSKGEEALFTIDATQTALTFSAPDKGQTTGITIVVPLAAIGFGTATSAFGTDPVETGVKGTFLSQFDPAISDVEIKGTGSVTVLAAGAA